MAALVALLVALIAVAPPVHGSSQNCQAIFDHYLTLHHKEAKPYTGNNLLYFLHVPRTAGRTFHSCLLKMATHPGRRCPKAYDHLRFTNISMPNCYLLSSHDDFSVVSMLPDDAAVLSQVRDPVDRFLSAYEFAIEVASRMVVRRVPARKKPGRIATEDVWPWSFLVPFFYEDMRPKVAVAKAEILPPGGRWIEVQDGADTFYYNRALNSSKWELTDEEKATGVLPVLNPYDNHLVMSLKDFAQHPIASELLHNGASFQVLGITNYSHWGDAGEMRGCVWESNQVLDSMVTIAKERIKRFTHVGTTDRLYDSAASCVASMHLSVSSPAYGGGEDDTAESLSRRGKLQRRKIGDAGAGRNVQLPQDIPELAKAVRRIRTKLQGAQKALLDAIKEGLPARDLERQRTAVDHARKELIDAQDKLVAARGQLPTDEQEELDEQVTGDGTEQGTWTTDDQQQGQAVDAASEGTAGARRRLLEEATTNTEIATAGVGATQQQAGAGRGLQEAAADVVDAADSNFKRIPNTDIGTEFQRCAARAQSRSVKRREQSLSTLATADGRVITFSKQARKAIPQEVIDLIRSYNTMDTALHTLGLQLLAAKIDQHKQANAWKELPQVSLRDDTGPRTYFGRIPKPLKDGQHEGQDDEL